MKASEVASLVLSAITTGALIGFLNYKILNSKNDRLLVPSMAGKTKVGKDLDHLNLRVDRRRFLDRKLDPSSVMFLLPGCFQCSSVPPADWPNLLPNGKVQIFSPNSREEMPMAIVKWTQKRNVVFNAHDSLLPEEMRDVGPISFRADPTGKLVDFKYGWPKLK